MSHGDWVGRAVLGRYRVVMPIASGGQGAVYLARSEGAAGFARPVVVKRVLGRFSSDSRAQERFAREARITSQLRHPGIVSVLDFEREAESYVMVLEYVHGYDLRRWSRFVCDRRLVFDAEVAGYVLLRVLEALHYAHTLRAPDGAARQVIHRDISPANVLVDLNGHVKLTDFGIARMDAEEVTVVTSGVQIKGKLPYVAPEVYAGAAPSVASDLYACGVMLHELLLGRNEFRAIGGLEVMRLACTHKPTPLDRARRDVSHGFALVVDKVLAKKPEARFPSALEFAQALSETLRTPHAELEARFRARLRADFDDPAMARFLEVPALTELDHAWRNAPPLERHVDPERLATAPTVPFTTESIVTVGSASTLVDLPRPQPLRESTRPSTAAAPRAPLRVPPTLIVGLVLAVLVVVAGLAIGSARPDKAKFVYVQREQLAPPAAVAHAAEPLPAVEHVHPGTAAAAEPLADALGPEDTSEPAGEPSPQRGAGRESRRERARALRISRAFAAKRPQVERCFEQHRKHVGPVRGLAVELTIDRRGKVSAASLVPERLTSTDFGRCVLRTATETRFAAQPSKAVVRIPIKARLVR